MGENALPIFVLYFLYRKNKIKGRGKTSCSAKIIIVQLIQVINQNIP